MPLTSDRKKRFDKSNLFKIRFPMFDGDAIVCVTVTAEALQNLALPHGEHLLPIDVLFETYRARVEAIASVKYDAGALFEGELRILDTDVR